MTTGSSATRTGRSTRPSRPLQVTRSRADLTRRPAAEVIDDVAARVRRWGLPGVAWWVSSATLPPDTEATLRTRGGKQIDAVRILARELDDLPDLAVPADVRVELVADELAFRAASMITVRGWGRKEPTGAALAREYAAAIRDLQPGPASASWPRCRASQPRAAGARCAATWLMRKWRSCGVRSPCGSTGGAAATGRCWPNGCGWPASTARRWPW